MQKCAFVSRHSPNKDQIQLAAKASLELIHVGDVDAFNEISVFSKIRDFEFVCGVHPLVAIESLAHGKSWVQFNNINRAPEGEKPQFGTDLMVVITDGEDNTTYTL